MNTEKIGVFGSGTIGACEATLLTGNGYKTVVVGHSDTGLMRCQKSITQNWDDLIAQGVATTANKEAAMRLLTITNDPSLLKGCEIVFEAVAEDVEIKKSVYTKITEFCGRDISIASTTSSIDAGVLVNLVDNPSRFLIAHPFQPVHLLPLVELVLHPAVSQNTVDIISALLHDVNRQVVILKKSVPGFIVNRFAQALFREAIYLLEQGVADAEDIDKAMKYAVGMRYASIGLLEYYDDVGFELEEAIAKNVYPDLCNTMEIQETTRHGLEEGNTGRESGVGLYDWSLKNEDDYRLRKQAPYFPGVKLWHMPG